MGSYSSIYGTKRFYYDINDMIGPDCAAGIAGFEPAPWQPYSPEQGLRLGEPGVRSESQTGFTEVVHVDDGLHAVIIDWPKHAGHSTEAEWVEFLDTRYGWLYFGLEGEGKLKVEGFGPARRNGATCSLTVTPRKSTYIWHNGPASMRRGVSIAFHARYLNVHYPDLLNLCRHSLGEWFAGREVTLRDFDLPFLPVMNSATAALLNLSLEGELRYRFVCSTVQQLLCLGLAALVQKEFEEVRPARLSSRDKSVLRQVRDTLVSDLADPPSVEQMVERFGSNRNKLRFGFKALYGMTISEYLYRERMARAFSLLTATGLSVTEVAATVGYGHASNFTTAFKREFGRTPREIARTSH